MFLPVALSPIYYYRRSLAFEPLNLLALAALCGLALWLIRRRRRLPWTFFCAAWFAIALLPESNVMPLAQLRADRFLYLPILGAAIWIAVGLERLPSLAGTAAWTTHLPARAAGAALVAGLALATHAAAGVWRSDVSAWTRVAECHPWSATAFLLLGHAYLGADDAPRAEAAYLHAIALAPELAEGHLALARLYHTRGDQDAADRAAQRFVELAPNAPEGPALLAAMRQDSGR
jgi:tetratricopeptide (TPR) repeat protein